MASLVAGTKYRGDFEERIRSIMEEVAAAGDVILFIDEIHTIMGIGAAEGAVDAANIMKPKLARGELQVIGATTIAEYRKTIEKDGALPRTRWRLRSGFQYGISRHDFCRIRRWTCWMRQRPGCGSTGQACWRAE